MATVKTPARRAKHVKLVQIYRSDSKAIHKFSKFITGISFYYIQQVINPHRQREYIINTKVFTTQQITSHEMNFNSTIPRRWKRLL